MLPEKSAFLVLLLAATSKCSPTPQSDQRMDLSKRWHGQKHCTTDLIHTETTTGLMFGIYSDGTTVPCDEMGDATSAKGVKCYKTANPNVFGHRIKCPADPAPTRNPDGSKAKKIGDGLIKAWCAAATGGALAIDFANAVGCLLYGYYEAESDPIAENEEGATMVCDTILAGACTYFKDMAPKLEKAQDHDDCNGDESLCSFAGPGK